MAVILLIFAIVLLVVTESSIQRANPGRKVPQWLGTDLEPMRDKIVRAVGVGLAVAGGIQLSGTMGYWGILPAVAVTAVPAIMRFRHNRSATASA